jgi:pimeloyl-ACP methyl ester carboxylesterase
VGESRGRGVRLRTYAWPHAGRPRALLLHSLAAHGHWWDWVAPRLVARFDVLALDFRGHGGSAHAADGRYGFDDYVEDVVAVVATLGGAPPLVIGHSMGGYIAARLAAQHPARVAGVVITDILTTWPEDFAQFARRQAERPGPQFASVAAAGERFKLAPPDGRTPAERVRHLGEAGVVAQPGGGFTYAFDRGVFLHPPVDPWPFLGRIEAPALVVHGEHSPIMGAESAGRVAAAIPRGEAATLMGAHHHLVVEDPVRFAEIVLRWSESAIFRVQS